jgi:hypothetical protein
MFSCIFVIICTKKYWMVYVLHVVKKVSHNRFLYAMEVPGSLSTQRLDVKEEVFTVFLSLSRKFRGFSPKLSSSFVIIIPSFDVIPFTDTEIKLKLGVKLIFYINVSNILCLTLDWQVDKALELAINLLLWISIIVFFYSSYIAFNWCCGKNIQYYRL